MLAHPDKLSAPIATPMQILVNALPVDRKVDTKCFRRYSWLIWEGGLADPPTFEGFGFVHTLRAAFAS
jgi:hypothetical protein